MSRSEQVHVRLSQVEFEFLARCATQVGESAPTILRRLLRQHRRVLMESPKASLASGTLSPSAPAPPR